MAQTIARLPSAHQDNLERQTKKERNITADWAEKAGFCKKNKREMTQDIHAACSLLWAAGHGPTSFIQLRWGNICFVARAETKGKQCVPCQLAVPPCALFAMPIAPASCAVR